MSFQNWLADLLKKKPSEKPSATVSTKGSSGVVMQSPTTPPVVKNISISPSPGLGISLTSKGLFDDYIERVLSHEGGYTDRADDPGNWTGGRRGVGELRGTKYGISAASYPTLDIRNLTWEQAKEIYRTDFWERVGGDELPKGLSFQLLDAAINHGGGNAVRWLQRAVDVAADGKLGPVTEAAIAAADEADVVLKFNAERLRFYTQLSIWPTYGKGWVRRVADNLDYAAKDN